MPTCTLWTKASGSESAFDIYLEFKYCRNEMCGEFCKTDNNYPSISLVITFRSDLLSPLIV